MLSNQSATHHNLIVPGLFGCKTIELIALAIEILARVPVKIKGGSRCGVAYEFQSNDGERLKKRNWTQWVLILVVCETDCVLSVIHIALAVKSCQFTKLLKLHPN